MTSSPALAGDRRAGARAAAAGAASGHWPRELRSADATAARRPARRPGEMSLCVICHGLLDGPSLLADESGAALHPACLARRVPSDAGVALIAAAALVLIPFIRVWSA